MLNDPNTNVDVKNNCLIILSGGQDSAYCLQYALKNYNKIYTITFNYGQSHQKEITSAKILASTFGGVSEANQFYIDIPNILKSHSPLVSKNILTEYSSYESMVTEVGDSIEGTFIPMRNQLFITLAANYASFLGVETIITGVCSDDEANYPDCREPFIGALEFAIQKSLDNENLQINCPMLFKTKKDAILDLIHNSDRGYESLAYTHTSYSDSDIGLYSDHATLLRKEAFRKAGVPDPLVIRSYIQGKIALPNEENYIPFKGCSNNLFKLIRKVKQEIKNV